jgi:nucleoid DNA-binding protein
MAGLRQICLDMRAKCPYCNRTLDLSDFGVEMFRRMLRILGNGERVEIEGFGVFRAAVTKGREIKSAKAVVRKTRDKRIIRFKASGKAKSAVNEQYLAENKGKKQ